jgi:hypothetical protein
MAPPDLRDATGTWPTISAKNQRRLVQASSVHRTPNPTLGQINVSGLPEMRRNKIKISPKSRRRSSLFGLIQNAI